MVFINRKHSEETKRKIRLSCKGIHSGEDSASKRPEVRKKISLSCLGRPSSRKGVRLSQLTKDRISNSRKGKYFGNKNPNWKSGEVIVGGYTYLYNQLGSNFGGHYIKRANLVWYHQTGELIKSPCLLHHKNRDKQDDRFENLEKAADRKNHIYMNPPRIRK